MLNLPHLDQRLLRLIYVSSLILLPVLVIDCFECAAKSTAESEQQAQHQQVQGQQDLARRQIWSKELSRWPAYCLSLGKKTEPMFSACGHRLNAIRASQALQRQIRIEGFIQATPHIVDAKQVLTWLLSLKKNELNSTERVALIDLSREALQTSGQKEWYTILQKLLLESQWFSSISCSLTDECAVELRAFLDSALWLTKKQSEIVFWSAQDDYISQRAVALIPIAQYLSQSHPQALLESDQLAQTRQSLWSLRAELASLSLQPSQLKEWWQKELKQNQMSQKQAFKPVKESNSARFGLNFSRMRGLGRLLAQLDPQSTHELSLLYQEHALEGMKVYLQQRRNYPGYANPINAYGVIALSSEYQDDDFAWSVPGQRWQEEIQQVKPHSLPSEPIQASGMFSELAIRDQQGRRGLYFVRPNGQELLETEVDLSRPEFLQVRYTQDMLAVYPYFAKAPQRALLIGLGGGAMVHALQAYQPQLALDVVEIDPVVVRFARSLFGVQALEDRARQEQRHLKVITADGFAYLKQAQKEKKQYDIIWMDAFLQPTEETDSTGSPLNLKTVAFLKEIADLNLTDRGVIAININHHEGLNRDLESVRSAFPASTVWQVPETGNYIALGFKNKPTLSQQELQDLAQFYTQKQESPFRYQTLLKRAFSNMKL